MTVVFRLKTSSVDDEVEEKDFMSREEAIAAAVSWFLDGYNNETLNDEHRGMAREEATKLVSALERDEEFCCGAFFERVSIARIHT